MYASIDEWLSEPEGFAIRRERVPNDAMPWIEEAAKVEREAIAAEARRCAAFYSQGSDGRNTFIMLAEWIESRSAKSV